MTGSIVSRCRDEISGRSVADRRLAQWLREQGQDVCEATGIAPDPGDRALLGWAVREQRIVLMAQLLEREWAEAQKTRKFGLVFDRHLPELVPIPRARPRRGDLVARKGGSLTDLWRVRRVSGPVAHCVRPKGTPGAGDPWDLELDELMVVRRFGEPIFPALTPVD